MIAKPPMSSAHDGGFTLVEVVVALGVFAIAVLGLMHAMGEQARVYAAIEEAAFARFVTDNQMARAMVDPLALRQGEADGQSELAGMNWEWRRTVTRTDDPFLVRIEVEVRREGTERVAAGAVAFRSVRGESVSVAP